MANEKSLKIKIQIEEIKSFNEKISIRGTSDFGISIGKRPYTSDLMRELTIETRVDASTGFFLCFV
ncbi:hypothetical protein BpHYR1_049071 [Brachionus plicatilis]|uniref:Uncharacterized protein n=1 Tax=Brachionus plicatilis TaxID=10195 RepID=A0A3M7SP12_BRAPC|nr:hypothetical protein BpHYR1_049071 [Brachionus plicatilis]